MQGHACGILGRYAYGAGRLCPVSINSAFSLDESSKKNTTPAGPIYNVVHNSHVALRHKTKGVSLKHEWLGPRHNGHETSHLNI